MKQFLPSRLGACSLTFLLLIEACAGVLRAGTKTWGDSFRSFRSHRGATCRLGSRQGKGAPRQFRDATWIPVFPDIRRDIPDTYELPLPLFEYFLNQAGGQVMGALPTRRLQQLRYLREGVFLRTSTPEQAAREALKRTQCPGVRSAEDLAALQNFAQDMRSGAVH